MDEYWDLEFAIESTNEPDNVQDTLDEAQKLFYQISQATNASSGILIHDILSGLKSESQVAFLKELEERQERFQRLGPEEAGVTGVPTHFVDFDKGREEAHTDNKRIFLYFGRYGCGWCDKTNKEAFSDADIRRRYIDHYVLIYVDAESGRRLTLPSGERITERELGVRYRAFATPLFVYMEPNGATIAKIAGIQTSKDLGDYDRFVHGGVYKTKSFREFLAEVQ